MKVVFKTAVQRKNSHQNPLKRIRRTQSHTLCPLFIRCSKKIIKPNGTHTHREKSTPYACCALHRFRSSHHCITAVVIMANASTTNRDYHLLSGTCKLNINQHVGADGSIQGIASATKRIDHQFNRDLMLSFVHIFDYILRDEEQTKRHPCCAHELIKFWFGNLFKFSLGGNVNTFFGNF